MHTRKYRERFLLDEFLRKAGLLLSQITPDETPDFIANAESGSIGIEITELFLRNGSNFGSLQAKESLQDRVLKDAQAHYLSNGGPEVRAHILFRDGMDLREAARRKLAIEIATHVLTLKDFDGELHRLPAPRLGCLLADFVTSVYAGSVVTREQCRWLTPRAGGVGDIRIDDLQARIAEKARLAPSYAGRFAETWLLLVGDRTRNASKLRWPAGVDAGVLRSTFTRTFVYLHPDVVVACPHSLASVA
jgi:hypothetical protein